MKQLEEKGWTDKIEASFLEIYNETIRDLLVSPKEAKNLTYDIKLVDNKKHDTYVTNLKVVPVLDETHVHQLLRCHNSNGQWQPPTQKNMHPILIQSSALSFWERAQKTDIL